MTSVWQILLYFYLHWHFHVFISLLWRTLWDSLLSALQTKTSILLLYFIIHLIWCPTMMMEISSTMIYRWLGIEKAELSDIYNTSDHLYNWVKVRATLHVGHLLYRLFESISHGAISLPLMLMLCYMCLMLSVFGAALSAAYFLYFFQCSQLWPIKCHISANSQLQIVLPYQNKYLP